MLQLIKFEFRKVFHSVYMYVIFGIGIFLALMNIFANQLINNILIELGEEGLQFSGYLNAKSALSNSFSLLTGIFLGLFCCQDFSQRTINNILGRGYSRLKIFYSKYIVSLTLVVCWAILLVLISLGLGYAVFGDGGFAITDNVAVIFLGQLLCVITYHALFFFVAYSIGKTPGAIAINVLVPNAIASILTIIDIAISGESYIIGGGKTLVSNYWIDGVFSNLSTQFTNTDILLTQMLLLLAYLAISHGLSVLIASKKQY